MGAVHTQTRRKATDSEAIAQTLCKNKTIEKTQTKNIEENTLRRNTPAFRAAARRAVR